MKNKEPDEYIKYYYFAKDYRDGLVPDKSEIVKVKRENILKKITKLKSKIKEFKSTDASEKLQITIEMTKKLIELSEKKYGDNLERLERECDAKLEDLYMIVIDFETEIEKIEREQQETLNKQVKEL